MTFDEYYETAKSIMLGEYDEYLDQIENAVKLRRKDKAPRIWEFSVGDKVRYNSETNPKYLRGATGTIVRVNRTKVVIHLDQPVGRFQGNINTPTALLERVSV